MVSLNPVYPCLSSGSPSCPCHWPRCDSRPCGCQKTSHNHYSPFRLTWILTRARRCSPACCCLNSQVNQTIKVMSLIRREWSPDALSNWWLICVIRSSDCHCMHPPTVFLHSTSVQISAAVLLKRLPEWSRSVPALWHLSNIPHQSLYHLLVFSAPQFLMTLSHDLLKEAHCALRPLILSCSVCQLRVCVRDHSAHNRSGPLLSLEALLGYVFQKCSGLDS